MGNGEFSSLASSIQAVASPFRQYLQDLHTKYGAIDEGAVADYIPELALADPNWFGICVVTTGGQVFEVGDCDKLFTIQSISKAFVYKLALEDHGRDSSTARSVWNPPGKRLTPSCWMKPPIAPTTPW